MPHTTTAAMHNSRTPPAAQSFATFARGWKSGEQRSIAASIAVFISSNDNRAQAIMRHMRYSGMLNEMYHELICRNKNPRQWILKFFWVLKAYDMPASAWLSDESIDRWTLIPPKTIECFRIKLSFCEFGYMCLNTYPQIFRRIFLS